jgi:MFS family permease
MSSSYRRRNLALLWIGQFVSAVGDAAIFPALIFLVLALEGRGGGTRAGVVSLASTAPFLIFGLVAGVIVDRSRRVRLMVVCDLARAALLFAVPAAYWAGVLDWFALAVIAFGSGTFTALFNPARDALIPDVGAGENLVRVNSFFQTSIQSAIVVGTALAAMLLGLSGAIGASEVPRLVLLFAADAGTFLVSAMALALLRLPADVRRPQCRRPGSALDDVREALRTVRGSSLLKGLLFITAVDNFFIMGPATVGANLLIRQTMGRGPAAMALFETTLAVGWFLATLLLLRHAARVPKGITVIVGMILDGLTYLPMFWIRSYPLLLAAIFVHALAIPLIVVCRAAIIQEAVPRENLGKIFSLLNLTIFGLWSLSSLVTGIAGDLLARHLGDELAAPTIFLVAGLGGALSGLAALGFRGLRQTR